MCKLSLVFLWIFLSFSGYTQPAEVVVLRHDLRWVDESRFPNYFLSDEIRESIFIAIQDELINYLSTETIDLPENVSYKIINGFGNQKVIMPKVKSKNDYEIGIFSFITRATVGFSIYWKFTLVIKKKGEVILYNEVIHELEYFNVTGYISSIQWLEAYEFEKIFIRLLQESIGSLPPSNDPIIISSGARQEQKAQALFSESTRYLLKIDGNWKTEGDFVAQLDSPIDTLMNLKFNEKFNWEFPIPTFSYFLSQLFFQVTGVNLVYEELIEKEKKGEITFSDGDEVGILYKWIEKETNMAYSYQLNTKETFKPFIAELYSKERQVGYFVFTQEEIIHNTDKTESAFNAFNGMQSKNTLGIDRIHRIEGEIYEKPILAEYNETQGIIEMKSEGELLGVMVVANMNPGNRSFSNAKLSKNKRIISQFEIGKSSLKNSKSVEWFPIYFKNGFSDENSKICIETLIFLFFGIGYM